jgi:outer membrane lipoprotein-sorting protein
MKKLIAAIVLPVAFLSGCAVQPVQPEKTSLEMFKSMKAAESKAK